MESQKDSKLVDSLQSRVIIGLDSLSEERNLMDSRKVIITGIGAISPLGTNREQFRTNLISGKSGIEPTTLFDVSSYSSKLTGEVRGFDPFLYMSAKMIGKTERCSQFALAATRLAMEDAGIKKKDIVPLRTATAFGTTIGGIGFLVDQCQNFIEKGPQEINRYTSSISYPNALSSNVSIVWNAQGPSKTFSSACVSSFDAISYGFELIKTGRADLAIVGGSEAILFPLFFASISLTGILSTRDNSDGLGTPRPFDAQRDGTILGEGAGVIVLEDSKKAMLRGAKNYGEILGYGFSSDAYRIKAPQPEARGFRTAMQRALLRSGINPEKIDYIQAHGTGTKLGDAIETMAIKEVFGEHAYRMKISAVKSMIGHLMGASGAVELCASLLCLSTGVVPPTINYQYRDPKCDLDYVSNKARTAKVDYFIANCFGFGGKNGVLVLKTGDSAIH